jgi:hypothetical protein
VRGLLAALLLAGGLALPARAQLALEQVQVLHDSRMPATLCNATTAIRVLTAPLKVDVLHNDKDRDVEIERMTVQPDGSIERHHALVLPGVIQCLDDYVSVAWSGVSGDIFPRFMRWPHDATTPVELGVGNNVAMAGPGIVFVSIYPTMTVKQTREQFRQPLFLLLPPGLEDWPQSSVRVGASPTGAPLLLATLRSTYGNLVGVGVIETGRDPVAMHGADLRIDGVSETLQAAVLSTWGGRPGLRFAYRIPANDFNTLVVGAATCDPPRALSDDVVTCRPLARMRVPSHGPPFTPDQLKEADLALIAIAEGGTRAFVATTDSGSWCLRATPLDAGAVAAPSTCLLQQLGAAIGLGAISDREVLLLVTQGEKDETVYRLLRLRGI